MGDNAKIRRARRGDRESIAMLLKELGYPDAGDAGSLLWVLNHPEVEVWVAVDKSDRPVGFISLSHRPQLRLSGRITTIDELVVSESARAKGVGSALLATAIDRAKALSAKRVELMTHRGRASYRRAFYEKNGFVEADSAVMRFGALEKP